MATARRMGDPEGITLADAPSAIPVLGSWVASMRRDFVLKVIASCCLLFLALSAGAVDTIPTLWEAGGLSAGSASAGQAARLAVDSAGNLAVVSGPSQARDLAVTSYTGSGVHRWTCVVPPASGIFLGDWIAAAPNGDFVAVGHAASGATGDPFALVLIRVGADGTLLWRVDLARTLPSVGRLVVDTSGNSYLAFSSVGDGQDIQLHAYDPDGLLRWSAVINSGPLSNNIATSLALSADQRDIAVTGDTTGGSEWITALYDASTGGRRWLVIAPEGSATRDVAIDDTHVYVTGQGSVGITGHLTVVALDRTDGARLWRSDMKPVDGANAAGLRIALTPDGNLVVTGQGLHGFLDWYTVSFDTSGAVRWEAVRDGGLPTDEVPTGLTALADGTVVVSGPGGPPLPGGFIQGVTAGYLSDGTLQWEAFSPLATTWVTGAPNGDVCATGGYDAYLACFRPSPVRIGTVPDGNITPGQPMLLSRSADGSLSFTWGAACVPADSDYAVYEGALGRPFTRHVPLACSTASIASVAAAPAGGSTYYLVAAHDAFFEGSPGTDSAGNLRSSGPSPCLPMAGLLGCP